MEELQPEIAHDTPVWAIFGDLMAGLVGVFVLILVWVLGYQLELTQSLQEETSKRQAEEQRRMALEEAGIRNSELIRIIQNAFKKGNSEEDRPSRNKPSEASERVRRQNEKLEKKRKRRQKIREIKDRIKGKKN